jgi:hypothetical protein
MEDDMTQDEDTEGPIGDGLANEESGNIPPQREAYYFKANLVG